MKLIPTPDATPAIAALFAEAAELTTTANERLTRPALSPSVTRRSMRTGAGLRRDPDRSFRARLATQQEVADLRTSGAWPDGWTLDPACFVYAIVRGSCTRIEAVYLVSPVPNREPREDELRHMWGRAVVAIARGTGQ
jgi:hypothetical protein